jgi:hypothetical protein
VFNIAPGVGIALALLSGPALFRAVGFVVRGKRRGEQTSGGDKVLLFVGSLVFVTLITVTAGVAFFVTCWAGFTVGIYSSQALGSRGYDSMSYGLLVGIAAGVVTGMFVGVALLRKYWRVSLLLDDR